VSSHGDQRRRDERARHHPIHAPGPPAASSTPLCRTSPGGESRCSRCPAESTRTPSRSVARSHGWGASELHPALEHVGARHGPSRRWSAVVH
jgi:hypothetical protein